MIITMLVVMLSRMAERMNVMNAIRHNSTRLLLVCITRRTQSKPPFWSTTSTMVMAPMRKKSVVPVSPRWPWMMSVTKTMTGFTVLPSPGCCKLRTSMNWGCIKETR